MVVCIIPARGGSKGIVRKNVQKLCGIPLVAHSIRHALECRGVERVAVSTDDAEIASVARRWGAEPIIRPADISDDRSSSESALLHALNDLEKVKRLKVSQIVFLQATSPCRAPGEIDRALDTFQREQADSLFSASPAHGFLWRQRSDQPPRPLNYDPGKRPRRQEMLETDLIENGSIYIFKPWVLRQLNCRLGGRIAVHWMHPLDSFQVDVPEDIEVLESLMRYRLDQQNRKALQSNNGVKVPQGQADAIRVSLSSEWADIRLLVLDFDGVLTDNKVLVDETGRESIVCNRSDGLGLERLKARGVRVMVLSQERNGVVAARCRKLGLPCLQGCTDKLGTLQRIVEGDLQFGCNEVWGGKGERGDFGGIQRSQVAYVGNDVNDLACLRWVAWPIAVADAVPEVLASAKYVTRSAGGRGAVREICDLLVESMPRRTA